MFHRSVWAPRSSGGRFVASLPSSSRCGCRRDTSGRLPRRHRADPSESVSGMCSFSIDGLRQDAIERYGATTLQRLMRRAATRCPDDDHQRQTCRRTVDADGQPPERHGVLWNSVRTPRRSRLRSRRVFPVWLAPTGTARPPFSARRVRHSIRRTPTTRSTGWWFGVSSERTVSDVAEYLDAQPQRALRALTIHCGHAPAG